MQFNIGLHIYIRDFQGNILFPFNYKISHFILKRNFCLITLNKYVIIFIYGNNKFLIRYYSPLKFPAYT